MSPEEMEVGEGISRRRMLKRIGAGAAVAWSAPILTSLKTPAFAATPTCQCSAQQCDVLSPCGINCGCFQNQAGGCACVDLKDGFCASFNPCNTAADCAPGEVCFL